VIHFLDMTQFNRRQEMRRRHEIAARAMCLVIYCSVAVLAGVLVGRIAACL